jgi:hypothetical protein
LVVVPERLFPTALEIDLVALFARARSKWRKFPV